MAIAHDPHLLDLAAELSIPLSTRFVHTIAKEIGDPRARNRKSLPTYSLRALCLVSKSQVLCFQQNTRSFCKTPGVGGSPFRHFRFEAQSASRMEHISTLMQNTDPP